MAKTTDEITRFVNNAGGFAAQEATKQKLWENSRYLVAANIAHSQTSVTKDGYFKGHHVIPGPKCDPTLQPRLRVQDYNILENVHGITLTNYETTDGSSDDIGQALYRIMDNDEADHYEAVLRKLKYGTEKSERVLS